MEGKNTDVNKDKVVEEIKKYEIVDKKEKEIEKKEGAEITQTAEESMLEQPSISIKDLSVSQVLAIIADANKKLSKLIQLFEEKIAEDETKGKLFERLHDELSRYKEDFVFDKILRRLFLDLIRLFDRISAVKEHFSLSECASKDVLDNLESFCKEIVQILKNQEVTLIEKEVEKFNEKFQEARETEPTDKPEEDLDTADVIKKGFIYRGRRLLRPEIVKVKKYKEV